MTLFTKNPLERLMMQRPYPGKEETPRTPAPEGHFCCAVPATAPSASVPATVTPICGKRLCGKSRSVRTPTLAAFSHRCYNVPMKDQMQRKRM